MRLRSPHPFRWPAGALIGVRAIVGCLLLAGSVAVAVVVLGLGQIDQLSRDLGHNRSVKVDKGVLATTRFGGAETLLLVGDDTRSEYKHYNGFVPNLANEMLLVRIDPSQPTISMLSIPRELYTHIDCPNGAVSTRLNYALACGGFNTLVSTLKQVTGLGVNHVVLIDFANFEKAVDQIGCVYYQVDERYYHVNVPGGAQYQQINLEPGYQRLCGSAAEQFVSYRHDDTSLIRDARDQSFLLAVKQQFGGQLISRSGTFESIFGHLVSADAGLKSQSGILALLGTLIHSAGDSVRQVPVSGVDYSPANPAAQACNCVTAPSADIAAAAYSFLHGGAAAAPVHHHPAALTHVTHHTPASLALTPTTASQRAQATALQSHVPGLRVEFPSVSLLPGAGLPLEFRPYRITSPDHVSYPAFVEVFPVGLLGQYYDVEGTTWSDAPALSGAQESVRVGAITYDLSLTGAHIDQVAWSEHGGVYWVHNSLTDGVSNAQMLAIAEQTAPVTGPVAAGRRAVRLGAQPTGTVVRLTGRSSAWLGVGHVAGIVGVILLPIGLGGLIWRRRRLADLRRTHAQLQAQLQRLEGALRAAERRSPRRARSAPSRSTSPEPGRGRRTPGASARRGTAG